MTAQQTSAHDDELLHELSSVLEQAKAVRIDAGELSLLEALENPDLGVGPKASIEVHKFADTITELIQRDTRFPVGRVKMIRGEDGGGSGFYPMLVGQLLVLRVLRSGDPKEAIRWVEKVLRTQKAEGKSITALWGVPIERAASLTETVDIAPIESLPDSQQKRRITSLFTEGKGPLMTILHLTQPTSALVARHCVEPFICDPTDGHEPRAAWSTQGLLAEIALVLTVVGPRVALQAAHWFTIDDLDLEEASLLRHAHSQPLIEILPTVHSTYPPLDVDEAREVIAKYLALPDHTKDKLRVALQRLSQAQLRRMVGDRAVELSIALETLMGNDGNSEMTHKISVRAVRLLGGTAEIRKKNLQLIKKAYTIRSALVHKGHHQTGMETIAGHPIQVEEILTAAIVLCASLIKVIIRRGALPNWSEFDVMEGVA